MSVSAFIPVYNEEKRISYTLKSLQWCDEIIVLDKQSTDKTREIAAKFNCKIYTTPNTNKYTSNEFDFLKYCTCDWITIFTASDIIHPELALKVKELTNRHNFNYDTIHVPFHTYILGLDSKRSPWHTELKPYFFRKSALEINKKGVHDALQVDSDKNFKLKMPHKFCIYHLTHESVDIMMERHLRYWRGEADNFQNENLKIPFKKVISVLINLILKRKTFLMGWDGIMLTFAFLSYYMMSFVYKWEKKRNKATEVYDKIKTDLLRDLDNFKF